MVISGPGLEELLSPLAFALAAALEGGDVLRYVQGPAVRVLAEGFTGHLHGPSRPSGWFARAGLTKAGHIPAQDELRQLRAPGARRYACAGSMRHFKAATAGLAFAGVAIAGYLTFMETMARAGISVFLHQPPPSRHQSARAAAASRPVSARAPATARTRWLAVPVINRASEGSSRAPPSPRLRSRALQLRSRAMPAPARSGARKNAQDRGSVRRIAGGVTPDLGSGVVAETGQGDVDVFPVTLGEVPHRLDPDRKLESSGLPVTSDGRRPRLEVTALPGDGVPPGHEVGEPAACCRSVQSGPPA